LVLLDIGARCAGYPADITRTYAVGEPTERQRAVHNAVRDAHTQIISLVRPELSFAQYQDEVDVIMKDALHQLDLLHTEADYRRYFPHAIGHGLGIDVHDSLGGFEVLRPGMVMTVEPGIYIPEEDIGVRLEDDILITDSGCTNLSEALSLEL
jgi:Xaa-Pro aminopeptidase